MEDNKFKYKITFVFVTFISLFALVLGKAFYVQIWNNDALKKYSESQVFRQIKVYPKRGIIYDRNGSPMALNIKTYSIFTIPKNLKGKYKTLKKLAKIVPSLTYKKALSKIKKRQNYTWLGRKIVLNDEQVKQVKDLKGIYIEEVPKRKYPNGELASQIIGFVGVDNSGLAGIEYKFNDKLKGEPHVIKYMKDAKGRPIKFEGHDATTQSEDIYLTIDKDLQAVVEKHIKDAVIKHEAIKGGVGVINSKTGEILAMANYPTFNPNELRSSKPEHRKLSFVTDPFEPGSTFKLFTVASALENKVAAPDTTYYCERGNFKVEDHFINEADNHKQFEWLTVSEIIEHSSNIGTTKIAFDLTYPLLKETLDDIGIGVKTNIELPGESRGIHTDKENIRPLSLSNISFGQGVATTGIQMLYAYTAIANEGILTRPTIIKDTPLEDRQRRVFSKDTANKLSEMLVKAVEDGTGANAKVSYFKIAGKTSTAQRVDEAGGYKGYIPGFIGFPVGVNNDFIIYVYVDKPAGKKFYGGQIAAPVFSKIAEYLLYKNKEYLDVAIDSSKHNVEVMDSVNRKLSSTRNMGEHFVPDFVGLDKKSATNLAEKLGIKVSHKGIGVVKSQYPDPGTDKSLVNYVKLIYSPPSYE